MKALKMMLFASIFFALSCSKDDNNDQPAPKPVDEQVAAVLTALDKNSDLSLFTQDLKNTDFADVNADALTVFAVKNEGIKSKASTLTDSELKRHIVKGSYDLAQLKGSTLLISLSGDSLKITKQGDTLVLINGIAIVSSGEKAGKSVIFILPSKLPASNKPVPPSGKTITFLVKECNANWSPVGDTTEGIPVEGATLKLYKDGASTAQTFTSDNTGHITVTCDYGSSYTYSISKGDSKDLYYTAESSALGLGLVIKGINTNLLDPWAKTFSNLGLLKFSDLNGDGIIDPRDKVEARSFDSIFVYQKNSIEVYIAPSSFTNKANARFKQLREQINSTSFKQFIASNFSVDAALTARRSSDTTRTFPVAYNPLTNYTLTPSNAAVASLWDVGYATVAAINEVMEIPTGLTYLDTADVNKLYADMRSKRLYVYATLANYFGGLPYITQTSETAPARLSQGEVYDAIIQEGTNLVNVATDEYKDRVLMLMARVYMAQRNYPKVKELCDQLINSRRYQLPADPSKMYQLDRVPSSIIWPGNENTFTPAASYPTNMNKKGGNCAPLMHVTELLLMQAEALVKMGNLTLAVDQGINIVRMAYGYSHSTILSQAEAMNELYFLTRAELDAEGLRYAASKRWDTFIQDFGFVGAQEKHKLLPIPQSAINSNNKLTQNPGY